MSLISNNRCGSIGTLSGWSNYRGAIILKADIRSCSWRPRAIEQAQLELTHNWDPEPYGAGRNFGHLAYAVEDIYATCRRLMDHGVTINRPPRDGRMAFVRSPDNISVELLQRGAALPPAEPWTTMQNSGVW